MEKVHQQCDCIFGSIINGCRKHIMHSFGLTLPAGQKIYKKPRFKLFEKIKKSVLSHVTFHLEDDYHKPVHFKGETISFTCQILNI